MKVVRDKFFSEGLFPAGLSVFLAAMEWMRWHNQSTPNPALMTIIAFLTLIWAGFYFRKTKQKLARLALGRDGEIAVSQTLNKLRADGYEVLNDLQGEDWNIDHVLIGPSGVYTIETKTLRKPRRGPTIINYAGNKLTKGKLDLSAHLRQAKAQANTRRTSGYWNPRHFCSG